MLINADFSTRVVLRPDELSWIPSPMSGVERKMLDRVGDEVARATSVVRYAPNSHFPAHAHGGGEEFLVLEGVAVHKVIDTQAGHYQAGSAPGIWVLPLHEFGAERVALVRWAPGSSSPRHRHRGGVEVFVLEGVFQDEHGHYPSGSWIRGPDGWEHTPFSGTGCLCYLKSGHLAT